MQTFTIKQFQATFPNDDVCLDWLRDKRWPERIECPGCHKASKFHRIRGRKAYECDHCAYQLSPTAGTIFHKSRTPLTSWFYAVYLLAQTRTGISAKQLERELGVTYKTAWRMFTQIRKLMDEEIDPLSGAVEVDETYIGGRDRNRHSSKRSGSRGRGATGKAVVVGAVQRKGNIVAEVAPDVKAQTVIPFIKSYVMPKSTVFTDELLSYQSVERQGYVHERVHHAARVYVSGSAHTNTIEGFWSLVKRGISGVHHVVSSKYLQDYINAYTWRWNHRDDESPMFSLLLGRVPSVLSSSRARGG
jgi:transposase